MPEENPYAVGEAALIEPPVLQPQHRTWFCDGKVLMVQTEAYLPRICIHTGEAVDERGWNGTRKFPRQFAFIFLWGILSILGAVVFETWILLLLPLLAMISRGRRKKVVISYWVSAQRHRRNRLRRWGGSASVLLGIAMLALLPYGFTAFGGVTAFSLMMGALAAISFGIGSIFLINPWNIKEHLDGWFVVHNCQPVFLAALEKEGEDTKHPSYEPGREQDILS